MSGVGSTSGWRRTQGESPAECGPGLCCPSRRSPWVSPSESGGQWAVPWAGGTVSVVALEWSGAWLTTSLVPGLHTHTQVRKEHRVPITLHHRPRTGTSGAALGRARLCRLPARLGRRGVPAGPTFRERFRLHLRFHSEPSNLTCASVYTTALPSPFRSAHPSPIPVWSEPSWSVTTLCNTVATR